MLATKRMLAHTVAKKSSMTKIDTLRMINSLIEAILENFEEGNDVILKGLGRFSLFIQNERTFSTPMIPQSPVTIPRHIVVRFHPSKVLKDLLPNA